MDIINQLPFFFKSHIDSNNGGFPHSYKFNLYFDDEYKMFRQKPSKELSELLNTVYLNGSLVEGSMSSESGRIYIEKITDYLFHKFSFKENSNILEIGFGSGVLLKSLKDKRIKNLFGIEPGAHEKISGLEGITLINDFYPSDKCKIKMDLIFSFGILEHIENPLLFLNEQINQLTDNGKIIFSVPNCEPYLNEGDFSILLHEHFSYFTKESIVKLVNKTNFFLHDISVIEGTYIVTIGKDDMGSTSYEVFSKEVFYNKITKHIQLVKNLCQNYQSHEIAIYSPIRAVNTLFISGYINVRLVDDNGELQGKYLPSLTSIIESFDQIAENPPKCILIFSRTFGERIKTKCRLEERLKYTTIITLSDLENENIDDINIKLD